MSPKPQPTETQFDHMQVVAAAQGPEAEARRQEMGSWSENIGAHAEAASNAVKRASQIAIDQGFSEEGVKSYLGQVTEAQMTEDGTPVHQRIDSKGRETFEKWVKPTKTGVQVQYPDYKESHRSPSNIRVKVN